MKSSSSSTMITFFAFFAITERALKKIATRPAIWIRSERHFPFRFRNLCKQFWLTRSASSQSILAVSQTCNHLSQGLNQSIHWFIFRFHEHLLVKENDWISMWIALENYFMGKKQIRINSLSNSSTQWLTSEGSSSWKMISCKWAMMSLRE